MVLKSKFILVIVFGTSSGCSKKMGFLVHLQVLARFYCQSLRRYPKNPKKIQKLKRYQKKNKNKDFPIFRPAGLQDMIFLVLFFWYLLMFLHFLFFWVLLRVLAQCYCQNLRRYQKNQKILPEPEELPKKTEKQKKENSKKNKKVSYLQTWWPPRHDCFFVFLFVLVPPQV